MLTILRIFCMHIIISNKQLSILLRVIAIGNNFLDYSIHANKLFLKHLEILEKILYPQKSSKYF